MAKKNYLILEQQKKKIIFQNANFNKIFIKPTQHLHRVTTTEQQYEYLQKFSYQFQFQAKDYDDEFMKS